MSLSTKDFFLMSLSTKDFFFLPQISQKGLNSLLWIKIDLLQLLMVHINGNGKTTLQMRKPLVESF